MGECTGEDVASGVPPSPLGLAALATTALLLTGCGSSTEEPAPTTAAPSSSPASTGDDPPGTSPAPTADPGTDESDATPATGCPATGDGVPAGASSGEIVDVDGDGRADTAWLTGGAERTFGVTTASGATFSTPIDSASPIPASAVVGVVGTDAVPIALVDLGREARLLTLADCTATPTVDAQGQPYVFGRGFGDQGTGVGCSEIDGTLRLAGLLATEEGDGWTVTRTLVDLSDEGRVATNGAVEEVASGAAADDPVVTTAQEVSCGDAVAGDDGLAEPGNA